MKREINVTPPTAGNFTGAHLKTTNCAHLWVDKIRVSNYGAPTTVRLGIGGHTAPVFHDYVWNTKALREAASFLNEVADKMDEVHYTPPAG